MRKVKCHAIEVMVEGRMEGVREGMADFLGEGDRRLGQGEDTLLVDTGTKNGD